MQMFSEVIYTYKVITGVLALLLAMFRSKDFISPKRTK